MIIEKYQSHHLIPATALLPMEDVNIYNAGSAKYQWITLTWRNWYE